MMTITNLLILLALVLTIASAVSRVPLWVAVLLVVIVQLLGHWPMR